MTSCIVGKKIGPVGLGHLVISLCCSGYLCVSKHLFCVKDFSKTTVPTILKYCTHDKYDWLYCAKEKRGHWTRPLELFPFVVLPIC